MGTLAEGIPLCFSRDGGMLATYEVDTQRLALWDLRLIRRQLAAMRLDWELPPLPPARPEALPKALNLVVLPATPATVFRPQDIPPRDPSTPANLVDLSQYYNAGLTRNWHNLGALHAPNDLATLPTGVQTLAGTPFDVRGLIQVGAQVGIAYPQQVAGIRVEQRCRRLHFLHSAVHADLMPDGTSLGRYVVHYADGTEADVPLVVDRDVANWREAPKPKDSPLVVAWRGTNSAGHRVRLFKTTWENPQPGRLVHSVDLVGERDRAAPFLVALTVE